MTISSNWTAKILPLRKQAEIQNRWLSHRLMTVLPEVMQREGFDMWIVINREYNEDPVFASLVPATMISARRLSMLVFSMQADGTLESLTISRYGLGLAGQYAPDWDVDQEEQWEALARVVRKRDPKVIGINCSETFAFGDGLSHSLYLSLENALGPDYMARTKGAERLAVGWLERRTRDEIDAYTGIIDIAHGIIAEAFSPRVVHPGVTTAEDVVWWFRQRINSLGLTAWFHPSVSIQRQGGPAGKDAVILPGDLLHCDVGLHYLGLATDTQQNAYVLKLGETEPPVGLQNALAIGNRLQDILAAEFVAGRGGNQILLQSLVQAQAEGIKACIYTHPLGYHGHGAGPTIGLWDAQQGVPGRGDYELFADTCHSMELNIKCTISEWDDQEVTMALEQDVMFTGGKVHFLGGRQTKLFLI